MNELFNSPPLQKESLAFHDMVNNVRFHRGALAFLGKAHSRSLLMVAETFWVPHALMKSGIEELIWVDIDAGLSEYFSWPP